jgi:membrane-associated protease RseP (regulator of RpoE activity)
LGVGGLFEGFKQRFAQSIVSLLPVLIVWFVLAVIYTVAYLVLVLPVFMSAGPDHPPEMQKFLSVLIRFMVVANIVGIPVGVFQLFFIFAPLAVWDCPQSGWEAAKASMRMVRDRFWSVLGFGVLGWLIGWLFSLGVIACYIGIFFTAPIAMLWFGSALVYLYRSWTGRPLAEPAPAPGGPAGSAVAPTDILPPKPV